MGACSKIAIIPARGGSKRIPGKNIKLFLGKPLISYTIQVAVCSGLFDSVVVSTDSPQIAEIAKRYGAEVPFLRPQALSDHYTGVCDVVAHTLQVLSDRGKEYQYCCMLYATAPLLRACYLKQSLNQLKKSGARYALAACPMPFPVQRTFSVDENGRCKMFWPEHYNSRSQDLELAYQDAGQFCWENLTIKTKENLFGSDTVVTVLPRHLVCDIDTPDDWEQAEMLYQIAKEKNQVDLFD